MSAVTDTRSILLNKASQLFVRHGYEGTSVRLIAEAAECHISAVSYYFGGKEKLYELCLNQFDENELLKVQSILTRPTDKVVVEKELTEFICGLAYFCLHNKSCLCLMAKEIYTSNPRIPNVKEWLYWPLFNQLVSYLKTAQTTKIIHQDLNIPFLVRTLFFMLQSEIVFNPSINININMEFISTEFMKICNRSIYV